MILVICGILLINGFILFLVEYFGNNLLVWIKIFFVFGIVFIMVFFIIFIGIKERVKVVK